LDYEHEYELSDGFLHVGTYRNDRNAYVRWKFGERSDELGGLTSDGLLVLDVPEYVTSGGNSETLRIPDEAVETLTRELEEVRDEIDDEMTDDERRIFEEDKQVFLRAREILSEEGVPEVDDYEKYEFDDAGNTVSLRAEEREGVAEVAVDAPGVDGYSPKYDLGKGVLSLPINDWGMSKDLDVPEDIAESLLSDLRDLQEQLNARREAYTDAVERAHEELDTEVAEE